MKIVGCDLHARQQTIAMVDTETGEFTEKTLSHEGNAVRAFYAGLAGPVVVGIEASGAMQWFLELLEELGIEYRVGYPAKIRAKETRKQKHDRRDAGLLLELLVEGRFPEIWMPSTEQRDLRTLLRDRQQWVRMRSRLQHTLQAIALNHGLRQGHGLWSEAGQCALQALPLPPYTAQRRNELLGLYRQLQKRIQGLEKEVEGQAQGRPQSRRLLTHPGVGPVTALATEMFLGEPSRFTTSNEVASSSGMIPCELQRKATAPGQTDQGRPLAAALSMDRSDETCGRERSRVETLLSSQAGAERNGKGQDRSGPQIRDSAMDHDARSD
jgi:transposase